MLEKTPTHKKSLKCSIKQTSQIYVAEEMSVFKKLLNTSFQEQKYNLSLVTHREVFPHH